MSQPRKAARFIASKSDPSRAEPVGAAELEHLVRRLSTVVMPVLNAAYVRLNRRGFVIPKYSCRGTLASMVVRHAAAKVSGWIYFQIHQSFGPLQSDQRVFWMHVFHRDGESEKGTPGRLEDLENPALIETIVTQFVTGCESLLGPQTRSPA